MSAYPNPALDQVTFTYPSTQGEGPASILVRDLAGRVVATIALSGVQGQRTWEVRGLAPGTYVVEYLAGAQVLHSERLVIQR